MNDSCEKVAPGQLSVGPTVHVFVGGRCYSMQWQDAWISIGAREKRKRVLSNLNIVEKCLLYLAVGVYGSTE